MSKAVLIMDMPENCNNCPLIVEECDCIMHSHCKATGNDTPEDETRAETCPLRELPERMKVCGRYPQPDGIVPSYKIGWNACLDAIEGGL